MKRDYFALLLVALFILFMPSVLALEIKTGKQSYLVGETFMAEINGEFVEQLKAMHIFFYKDNKEIEPAFYMMEASKQQYFIWVNLLSEGNYSFAVKNVLYKENEILKGNAKEVSFEVKPSINYFYNFIIEDVKANGWRSVEENALALSALAYDDALATEGKTALISDSKNGEGECWPSTCNVKETALAALALSNIASAIKKEWLIDSQNNLDLGLWDLQINSAAQQCKLLVNNDAQDLNLSDGTNTISLNLKSKPEAVIVKLNCSVASAKIIHTYLGEMNEFELQKQVDSSSITLNNKKCFGTGYRSECDSEATAYAVLALDSIKEEKQNAVDWLKKNAQSTKEKAIALYLSDSSEIEEWLLNNQHASGYWSSKGLIQDTTADYEATVFATLALKKEKRDNAVARGETWLRKNFASAAFKEKAEVLAFIFLPSGIEPILAVKPAAIKAQTNSTLSIEIFNKGVLPVNISAEFLPFKTKQSISVRQGSSAMLTLEVQTKIGRQIIVNETRGSIELAYKTSLLASNSYSIPVIILPQETAITNETIEILPSHFRFSISEINATVLVGEKMLVDVQLQDLSHYEIKEISLAYSRDLKDVLNITPPSINFINPGESAEIGLVLNSKKVQNISGFIEAKSTNPASVLTKLPINIIFTRNASAVSIVTGKNYTSLGKEKTCSQLNGTTCKQNFVCNQTAVRANDTDRCCLGSCKGGIDIRIIGALMIIAAIAIVAFVIMIKLRKPKKQAKDVYEEIEKKYSKFSR